MKVDLDTDDGLLALVIILGIALVAMFAVWGCAAPDSQFSQAQLYSYANGCDSGYPSACIALQAGFQSNLAVNQQADYDYQAHQARLQNFYLANQASREASFNTITSQLLNETR